VAVVRDTGAAAIAQQQRSADLGLSAADEEARDCLIHHAPDRVAGQEISRNFLLQ
jgi:hypothetical protein